MRLPIVVLAFGIVNSVLYSALLPLWEGFDEPFHFGYVESFWETHQLPVLGRTLLPEDVFQSFRLAPVGPVVQRWTPEAIRYSDWFELSSAEKDARRSELDRLRPRNASSSRPDYEAHHPPMAYLILAPLDWALSNSPLRTRVLAARMVASVFSTLLLFFGAATLCGTLRIPEPFATATLFTVFCSQMLYATIAHVANDWLAVGVSAMFLASLAEWVTRPDRRGALVMAAWLAAGLLTKAYFLSFALVAALIAVGLLWRRRVRPADALTAAGVVLACAGPWYARNMVLFGNMTGGQEELAGTGIRQTLAAALQIDWEAASGFLARGALWTGNSSFNTYSRGTLNLMLALLAVGLAAWAIRRRGSAEMACCAGAVVFSIAVAYQTCASFAYNHGNVPAASPWYTQVLLAPIMSLFYLGLSRWNRTGAALAAANLALWTWVLMASWVVKLFPMYSGASMGPMRARDLWNWYTAGAVAHAADLSRLALVPALALYAGMSTSIALGGFLASRLAISLIRRARS